MQTKTGIVSNLAATIIILYLDILDANMFESHQAKCFGWVLLPFSLPVVAGHIGGVSLHQVLPTLTELIKTFR